MHLITRVVAIDHTGPFELHVTFDDGTGQTIDFSPVLKGPVYGPLADPLVFATVAIDPEVGTLTWPNGADFDPATLHDWPAYSAELAERARVWELTRA
jgi:hypothetical protein